MREIKFRVYIPDHGKFSYFQLNDFDYSDRYLHQHSYPVQQSTGLKDKNGNDIYEGDILKHDIGLGPIYYKVYWDSENGQWKTNKEYGGNVGSWFYYYEVVGNIFENPELLK